MSASRRTGGFGPLVFVLLSLVLTGLPHNIALAQSGDAAGSLHLYRSPEFGYLFWWDLAEWTVIEREAKPEADWLEARGASGAVVDIRGMVEPGLSAASCLENRLAVIQSHPDLVRFERVEPRVIEAIDGPTASSKLVLGYADGAGVAVIAGRESCVSLGNDGQLLVVSERIDAKAFNALGANHGTGSLLNTLTLPPTAGFVAENALWQPEGTRIVVQPVVDPAGSTIGYFTLQDDSCTDSNTGQRIRVVITNSGPTNFSVSPDAWVNRNDESVVPSVPETARWLWPEHGARDTLEVASGNVAVLELVYARRGALDYVDAAGNLSELLDLGQCGGGGAAPALIDIENE